ncbi:MAG: v-SNARE N-terminal domain-containing protein [Planctomycetota bacterium]
MCTSRDIFTFVFYSWLCIGILGIPLSVTAIDNGPGIVADAVRYKGVRYFKIEVPNELISEPGFVFQVIPCGVVKGRLVQVYLIRGDIKAETKRKMPPGLSKEDEERYRTFEIVAKHEEEITEIQKKIEYLNELSQENDLPESSKQQILAKIREYNDQLKTVQRRKQEAEKRQQELFNKKTAKEPTLASDAEPVETVIVGIAKTSGISQLILPSVITFKKERIVKVIISEQIPAVETPPEWLNLWATAHLMREVYMQNDPDYVNYARSSIQRRFKLGPDIVPMSIDPGFTQAHPYDLFTGSTAIRESIQFDRRFRILSGGAGRIPVSSIQPLPLKDHPFDEMRAGRSFAGSQLSKLCPSGALYLHILSLKEWFRIKDLFNRWGGNFLSTIQINGRDYDLIGSYMKQLAVGDELIARLAGTHVVGELCLIAADPLFAEGTAIAVIFAPIKGQEQNFHSVFNLQRKANTTFMKDAVKEKLDVHGISVELLKTPDKGVNSYSCVIGEHRVFCNSRTLLKRIIESSADEEKSLFAAPDYRYYRALFPIDENESCFVFLSQDWFRRITSPAWRISRGRKLMVIYDMLKVKYSWQTAIATGVSTPGILTLQQMDLLPSDIISEPVIRLDPQSGEVSCESVGSFPLLNAVDENLPDEVTSQEKKLYDEFRENYTDYWRQYIDPVGIRLRLTDNELNAGTLILPLIENSIYNGLRSLTDVSANVSSVAPPLPFDTLGAITFRWSAKKAGLNRLLGKLVYPYHGERNDLDLGCFGDTVTVGVADGDMLFTASAGENMFSNMILGRDSGQAEAIIAASLLSSITLPTFAVVEVRDAEKVERFLRLLWSKAASGAGRGMNVRVLNYQTAQEPQIHTVTFTLFIADIRLHYTFVNNWLLVATKPDLLRRLIDAAKQNVKEPFSDNGRLVIFPSAFNKSSQVIGLAWQERIAGVCRRNFSALQRANDAGFFNKSKFFLGYDVCCPEEGKYSVEAGKVKCSIHGGIGEGFFQPLNPPQNAPAVKLVNEMQKVSVSYRFTDDGLQTRLRVLFNKLEE